jgi:RNA exonuclease 4
VFFALYFLLLFLSVLLGDDVLHGPCTDELVAARGYVGGVRKSRWREAAPLAEVAARASLELEGKLLVGHGLQGDLEALGLTHPRHLMRDTMNFRIFQRKGHARKLKSLAADLLGTKIQVYRHSARCVLHFQFQSKL